MNEAYSKLLEAVQHAAALRLRLRLEPAGGEGDKVFPATHRGGEIAEERRRIDGEVKDCVLLNSVQAEANCHEIALLGVKEPLIPRLQVDIPGHGVLTSLEAPHRAYDAIFRDCNADGKAFYASDVGTAIIGASERKPDALFRYCPNALLWGAWDSRAVGMASHRAARIPRAMTSEIIGVGAINGVTTGSRLDPLGLPTDIGVPVFRSPDQRSWAFEKQNDKDKQVKLTDIGHSRIPPTIQEGGVTVEYALQTTVISCNQLRRLGLPDDHARAALAAMGLLAFKLRYDSGYRLRSRCDLVRSAQASIEFVGLGDEAWKVGEIDASALLQEALNESALKFEPSPTQLEAKDDLRKILELGEKAVWKGLVTEDSSEGEAAE